MNMNMVWYGMPIWYSMVWVYIWMKWINPLYIYCKYRWNFNQKKNKIKTSPNNSLKQRRKNERTKEGMMKKIKWDQESTSQKKKTTRYTVHI